MPHVSQCEAVDPAACLVCRLRSRSIGLVCARCSEAIAGRVFLLPQQIVATAAARGHDALIDQWGRAHPLEASTEIGRTVATKGIAIFDVSISRRHARVRQTHGVWSVEDVGSSNGTYVNDERVHDKVLRNGDRICFGGTAFFAAFDLGCIGRVIEPVVVTSIGPIRRADCDALSEEATARFTREPLRIVEPRGGGGGLVETAEASAQLSATQLELVEILAQRMRGDAHLPPSVRGFVRSSELAGVLSWDAHLPDDSRVKHLVRRTRQALIRSGLGDLIESRHRFGYRLRVAHIDHETH